MRETPSSEGHEQAFDKLSFVLASHADWERSATTRQIAAEVFDLPIHHSDYPRATQRQLQAYVIGEFVEEEPVSPLATWLLMNGLESGVYLTDEVTAYAERLGIVNIAGHIEAMADEARNQMNIILEEVAPWQPRPEQLPLAFAWRTAEKVHEDYKRKAPPKRDYFEHPKEAAAMALYCFDTLKEEGYEIDEDLIQAVLTTILLHDAPEESLKFSKHFNPNAHFSTNPYFVRVALKELGQRYQFEIGHTLRLMIHDKGSGWMPDYGGYGLRGANNLLFCLAKPFDAWHNVEIEPKPASDDIAEEHKRRQKQAQYMALINILRVSAKKLPMLPGQTGVPPEIWVDRYFELLTSIRRNADTIGAGETEDPIPPKVRRLERYIFDNYPVAA